jgi:hypothetical protein
VRGTLIDGHSGFNLQLSVQSTDIEATHTYNATSPADVLFIDKHNAAFVYFKTFELTFISSGGLEYMQVRTGEYGSAEDDMPHLAFLRAPA